MSKNHFRRLQTELGGEKPMIFEKILLHGATGRLSPEIASVNPEGCILSAPASSVLDAVLLQGLVSLVFTCSGISGGANLVCEL